MPQANLNVFVSSTATDLQPERKAVEVVLQRLRETRYIGMEYFGGRDDSTLQASLDEVDRCQFYLGIFGGRYGSGITEEEYRRAKEKGLPCKFYIKSDAAISAEQRESDPEKARKLAALKDELRSNNTISPEFNTPEALARDVAIDLHNWLSDCYSASTPSIYPFVCILDHQQLFGADDFNAFSPSQREYREGRVHRPTISDVAETALGTDRFTCVLGRGASGKTTLALLLAFSSTLGPASTFYCDLAATEDTPEAADSCRAAMATIARQHGRDALFIVDNIHLAEQLAARLHVAWRDAGKPVRLLFLGRLTEKDPDNRGHQSPLAALRQTALTLSVEPEDLAGVLRRLAARREITLPSLTNSDLMGWLKVFGGDLIAFSFAARGKLSKYSRGADYTLSEKDACDYVRDEYLANPRRPLCQQETENLLALAACADLELAVPRESLPYPQYLSVSMQHGLVWRSTHGRGEQFIRYRFHHPGMGRLIWESATPSETRPEWRRKMATDNPYFGFLMAHRLVRIQHTAEDSEAAKAILAAAICNTNAIERLLENGMVSLKTQCQQVFQANILSPSELDQRLQGCSNLARAALNTPLHFLRNFLEYAKAQGKLPGVFAAISAALAAEDNRSALQEAALDTPLHFLRDFLEYAKAQRELAGVFTAIAATLAADNNRSALQEAALHTPLHFLRHFLEYAKATRELSGAFTAISDTLAAEENRSTLLSVALDTQLNNLASFLEYAQVNLPLVFEAISDTLSDTKNHPALARLALSTEFNNIIGFLRYTAKSFPALAESVNAAIAADFRARGIKHPRLESVRLDPRLLVSAQTVLNGCGCLDLIEEVACDLIRGHASGVWQRNKYSISLVSTVLRLGRGTPELETKQFLTKIVTPEWLESENAKLPPQIIAIALFSLWAWTPHFVRDHFRSDDLSARACGLVRNLYRCEPPARAVHSLELLGTCALFEVNATRTTRLWPSQSQLDDILRAFAADLGDEHLSAHQCLFFVGLREMCRRRPDHISIPPELGNRVLKLWQANESLNPNHHNANAWMISWLQDSASGGWWLIRDDSPIPETVELT